MINRKLVRTLALVVVLLGTLPIAAQPSAELQLSRPARPWEFMPAVGQQSALFGHESGTVEAWVYPMKLFRDFSLVFHVGDRAIPAESLVRTIEVRPEAVTLIYSGDTFSVRETFFAPREEPGAVIALDITAFQPVEVEVRFHRDFQLMWPAALGGTYASWDEKLKAFMFGEEQHKWFAMVGSPSAVNATSEFDTNYYSEGFDTFRLGPTAKGTDRKLIVIAGSVQNREQMLVTYQRLVTQYDALRAAAAKQYADYLSQTTSLSLPDQKLQQAYDWARVSTWQGLVTNPFLGTGLVAGYRTSGTSGRPGFAWFFGRDSEWTSFALNSEGDFTSTRTALQFLMSVQRGDGRIPHEISQAAKQVPWFADYPYPWASADATPLFILAMRDYYEHSGDAQFIRTHWENIWEAYQFLRTTWDDNGIPKNFGVGHGWVEGGPLLPVKTEFYQAGVGAEALNALATLATVAGKTNEAAQLAKLFTQRQKQLNDLFWNPQGNFYAFAINQQDKRIDTPTVLTTVPMWFGTTDARKSDATITHLADADHAADWGMRIISDKNPLFDPSGYHFGSVWPLFTGWASVAEYRYHRPYPAYENLRANALLTLNGSLGHTTEVLSGSFFEQLSTSSPHQIWSAAMVISPMLRGLLGIEGSTSLKRLTVAPHVPGSWTSWAASNVHLGVGTVDLSYSYSDGAITLVASPKQLTGTTLVFSPSVSPLAKVLGVTVNGRAAKYDVQKNAADQHVVVNVPMESASTSIRIRLQNDFALALDQDLPELGAASRNLHVVNETWGSDSVTYELAGLSGKTYEIGVRGAATTVEGAELSKDGKTLRVTIPAGETGYRHTQITVRFARK